MFLYLARFYFSYLGVYFFAAFLNCDVSVPSFLYVRVNSENFLRNRKNGEAPSHDHSGQVRSGRPRFPLFLNWNFDNNLGLQIG